MTLRILCLHDEGSSGIEMICKLKKLGRRLHNDHKIELAFVNAPHNISSSVVADANAEVADVDATPSTKTNSKRVEISPRTSLVNDDEEELDTCPEQQDVKRVWFHENKVGLDASILHLRQIWSQSFFSGVMGIGQGAAIAAMLPLLRYEDPLDEPSDDDEEEEHTNNKIQGGKMMFDGIRFCIFLDGWDILQQESFVGGGHQGYEDVRDIASLHVYSKSNHTSESLYQTFGGITCADSEGLSNATSFTVDHEPPTKINGLVMNAIGKFLVSQKKIIISQEKKLRRQLLQLKNNHVKGENNSSTTNAGVDDDERIVIEDVDHDGARLLVEKTRMELAMIETKAIEMINKVVAENPPKALMAVITPDSSRGGTLVGGWSGEKDAFRSENFKKSGGAPCPKEFTLKSDKRL